MLTCGLWRTATLTQKNDYSTTAQPCEFPDIQEIDSMRRFRHLQPLVAAEHTRGASPRAAQTTIDLGRRLRQRIDTRSRLPASYSRRLSTPPVVRNNSLNNPIEREVNSTP